LSLLPHKAKQRWHNKRENNEINRLDKLGVCECEQLLNGTSAHIRLFSAIH